MSDQVQKPSDQSLQYNIKKRKKVQFDSLYDISVKSYLGAVNGKFWQCQSCSEYSQLLYILLQLQKCTYIDTRSIKYHMLPFCRISNVCRGLKGVSSSHIHQQHGKLKVSE